MTVNTPEYSDYFKKYIALVSEKEVIIALENNLAETTSFFKSISPAKENYAYAEGKWTVKELLNHITDTERIFAYRALRYARNDKQVLAAYDEDQYASYSAKEVNNRSMASLIAEFECVRQSNILMYKHFSESSLRLTGLVPAGTLSVEGIGFILCGHAKHHMRIVREKYL